MNDMSWQKLMIDMFRKYKIARLKVKIISCNGYHQNPIEKYTKSEILAHIYMKKQVTSCILSKQIHLLTVIFEIVHQVYVLLEIIHMGVLV